MRLGHFCLKPVSSLIIEHFLWECSLFFFENQEAVSLSQAAASVTYKYRIEPTLITVSNTTYGSVTKTVTMYKETYINGVKQSEEPIPYSLLEQNSGYSPVSSATYTNSWGGIGRLKNLEIL